MIIEVTAIQLLYSTNNLALVVRRARISLESHSP